MREATAQQKKFVDEWLSRGRKDQGQCAIIAGYSERSAVAQASQLLNNPIVQAYVKERTAHIRDELQAKFLHDAERARDVMNEILANDESSDRDRITAAKDFLDRAGFKPTDKVEHSGEIKMPTIKIEKHRRNGN